MKTTNAIPEKYKSTILQIVEGIENSFICYLNPETLEIEQVKKRMIFRPEELEEQHDDMLDDYELDYVKWNDYIKFEPLGKDEKYLIMESFISDLDDEKLSEKLELALDDNDPIQAFKEAIDNCNERNTWIAYKHQKTIEHVQQILLNDPRMR